LPKPDLPPPRPVPAPPPPPRPVTPDNMSSDDIIYEESDDIIYEESASSIPPSGEINNLADVTDISALTASQLAHCLKLLHLGKYSEVFKDNQINGSLLVDLSLEELRDEPIGMNKLEAKKLQQFVNGWRPS
jgi:hypothetical protein